MASPLQLVYASAPEDEALRTQLARHLSGSVRVGLLQEWHEGLLQSGLETAEQRRHAWRNADIILLLVSADYFSSPAYDEHEITFALERHHRGEVRIIPLLLRPYDIEGTNLAPLQALPKDGKAITTAANQDEALAAIAQEIRHYISTQSSIRTPLSSQQRANRAYLLKRMRALWIEGLLKQSLQHATWLDLHLQQRPDALENPWRLFVQELGPTPDPLPAGTSIVQVCDEADEELLILGEPGAGKTTLLLYLARTLLDRAEKDEQRRIPVLFSLSSWPQQRLPLEQWLVQELKTRYQVPLEIGRTWVEADRIFPLLDGLDEVVDESARLACAQAISAYMQRSLDRTPLVVCCRNSEYQRLSIQLPLQNAVMLLPLTSEQIDSYLSSISGSVDSLRQAFAEDQELFELARRPLFLSVFTQAYQNTQRTEEQPAFTQLHTPQALFKYYVKQMLRRRTSLETGTREQVAGWLKYLATQMQREGQTILAIEDLQPTWLPQTMVQRYRWVLTLVYSLTFGLPFGLLFGIGFMLVYGLLYRTLERLAFGLSFGLLVGVLGGLLGGLIFGITFKEYQTIRPSEDARWSWSFSKKGFRAALPGSLAVGLIGGLTGGFVTSSPVAGLTLGIALVFLIVFVVGGVGGFSPLQLSERRDLAPNEGIWRSGRRGLTFAGSCIFLFGVAGGLIVGLLAPTIHTLQYALLFGSTLGAGGGLIFGLAFGLVGGRTGIAAFLQHYTLRFLLWRANLLPLNLVAFLNEAAQRLLLRRVGGSYIFLHRMLRDVLATLDDK